MKPTSFTFGGGNKGSSSQIKEDSKGEKLAEEEDKILSVIRRTLHIESAHKAEQRENDWRSYVQCYCG